MDSRSDSSIAQSFIGPYLVGTIIDIYLLGILTVQFIQYWIWYRDDKLSLQLAVIGLHVLAFLKSVQCFALTWIQCINHMNRLADALHLTQTAWWEIYNSLIVAVCNLYVQLYFCYRLWIISQRLWWPITAIILLLLASLGGIIYGSIEAQEFRSDSGIQNALGINLATGLAADVLLSVSTGFFLLRSRAGTEIKHSVVNALFRLTFQAQVPVVLCASLNLIFSQVYHHRDTFLPLAFHQCLPKLYGISMMWTVNERRHIRSITTVDSFSMEVFTSSKPVEHTGVRPATRLEDLNENASASCTPRAFELRPQAGDHACTSHAPA